MAQTPKIRAVPFTVDPSIAGILADLKAAVEHLTQGSQVPPQPPTSLSATPVAGGVVVQFTRSNATNFRVYASPTPDRSQASISDLGTNNQWTHSLGSGGVDRWYWVEAISHISNLPSKVVGPVKATSLPLTTAATVEPPAAASYATVFDTTLGIRRPVIPGTDFVTPGKRSQD